MWREPLLRRGATVAPPAQKRCAVDPSSSSSLSQAPEGNGCFCHILSYIWCQKYCVLLGCLFVLLLLNCTAVFVLSVLFCVAFCRCWWHFVRRIFPRGLLTVHSVWQISSVFGLFSLRF